MSRTQALHCVFDSVRGRLPVEYRFEDFERGLADWEVVPLTRNGAVIGGVLIKDNEIHVGYSSAPGAAARRHLKEILPKLFTHYGFVKTKVVESNSKGQRLCERLGFHEERRENGIIYLRCEKTRYA